MSNLVHTNNHYLPHRISRVVEVLQNSNEIKNSTNKDQAEQFLQAAIDIYSAANPNIGALELRNMIIDFVHASYKVGGIKSTSDENCGELIKLALGNSDIAKIAIAEREGFTLDSCLESVM